MVTQHALVVALSVYIVVLYLTPVSLGLLVHLHTAHWAIKGFESSPIIGTERSVIGLFVCSLNVNSKALYLCTAPELCRISILLGSDLASRVTKKHMESYYAQYTYILTYFTHV